VRILHFCNYADLIGGAEVYAHGLVESLRKRGHEVALFGASPGDEVDRTGLRVIQRPVYDPLRLVRDPAALAAVREYVQRFRPDVLHVHNVFSVALEVLHYLGTCGVPLLHTVHDFQLLCPNSWCVRGDGTACPGGAGAQCFQHQCQTNYPYDAWDVYLASLRQRLTSSCTRIAVAPSSYLVGHLRANGWREVRHLPYFVDFPAGPRSKQRTGHELLYVGRLEPEKGVGVLLAALPEILRGFSAVRLTLIGGGSQLPALRQQADQLGLGPAVRFVPRIPRQEISAHYATAEVCILPSVWSENSPLVAYECMQSGLPLVGSRLGGITELIEGVGFTFTPGDHRDLARTVVRFLRLPLTERESLSDAAINRAQSFDRENHLRAIESMYAELADQPPQGNIDPIFEPDLLEVLHQVGVEHANQAPGPTPLQVLRSIARTLGLPKVLRT